MTQHLCALTTCLCLLLSGCSFFTQTRPIGPPTISSHTLALMPQRTPTLHIEPFSNATGWHISVRQPAQAVIAQHSTQLWESQRATFSPPSLLIGLLQCPWGALVSTLSDHALGQDACVYGCERLRMREPVPGVLRYPKSTTFTQSVNATALPVNGHTLTLSHPTHLEPFLTRLISANGTLHLTRQEILAAWQGDHHVLSTIHLTLKNGPRIVTTASLTIPPHPHPSTPDTPIDSHLPHPFCITVDSEEASLRHHLEQWVLQEGWCLVAGKKERSLLRAELVQQYSGAVHEATRTPLGTWTPPTVVLRADWTRGDALHSLSLELLTMASGTVVEKVWLETYGETAALLPIEAWSHLRWRVKQLFAERTNAEGPRRLP